MKKFLGLVVLMGTFGWLGGHAAFSQSPFGTAPFAKGLGVAVTTCKLQSLTPATYSQITLSLTGVVC